MPIRLPRDAKNYDYEDQICATLHASGYYLETRLVLKKGSEEVLEFDAIATPVYNHEERKVVEVKSGKWGVSDIFKLYGQINYTGEKGGWLIHKVQADQAKHSAVSELLSNISINTYNINSESHQASEKIPKGLDIPDRTKRCIFSTSWWSKSADRIAQGKFRDWCKSYSDPPKVVMDAKQYVARINECLFKRNPLDRVNSLYNAYKAAPQLTSTLVDHIHNESGESKKSIRRSGSDCFGRTHLQFVMAQEYRARVAILKNAFDAVEMEISSRGLADTVDTWQDITAELLPNSFKNGMEAIRDFPQRERLPFFYQIFIEVFGGFYFTNYERDIENISLATGMPAPQIPRALDVIDVLFPIPKGWAHKWSDTCMLKGLPAYYRGAGCFARNALYGRNWEVNKINNISSIIPNWHNSLYYILEPHLSVDQ